jgi:glycosyltransferase involved in cell wall biosynthesis
MTARESGEKSTGTLPPCDGRGMGLQAVFFVNVWPEPRSSAAGIRTRELSQFMKRLGYEIVAVAPSEKTERSAEWETDHVRTLSCDPNSSLECDALKMLSPDLVVYDRFYTEEKFGWRARELWPDALHVIDTIDIHSLRGARQKAHAAGVDTKEPTDEFFDEDYLREMASLHRADVCLVVSDYEAAWLTKRGFEKERVCYLPFSASPQKNLKAQTSRNGFCFIGNYMHAPNVDAVKWLESELWPALRRQNPTAELHLYGAYPPQAISQLHGKNGIFSHGHVDDHRAAISQHQVMLAPLRFGAGIKGKVLEAWATGTPVLGTPLAFESMGEGFPQFTDATTFIQQIQRLEDPAYWQKTVEHGLQTLKKNFEAEAIFQTFAAFLKTSKVRLPQIRQSLTGRMLRHHGALSTKYLSRWIEEKNKNRK